MSHHDTSQVHTLIKHLETFVHDHHVPLLTLRLATYAADAMRVQDALRAHVRLTPSLESAIRTACPDWRNPGALDDPASLIPEVLTQVVHAMRDQLTTLNDLVQSFAMNSPSAEAQKESAPSKRTDNASSAQ